MLSEPFKIIFRRFINRLTESGLLIISVALGVGAFAAGGTLFVNVINENNDVLNSPSYKEIVVSTREETSAMEVPVKEKLLNQDAILAQSDLDAAQMIPSISYSYIMNDTRLKMINEDFENQANNFGGPPAAEDSQESEDSADNRPQGIMDEILDEGFDSILSDSSIVLSDEDEVSGYEVTSQFFDAWDLNAQYGSLFSLSDYNQTNSLVLLGSEFAQTLVEDGEDVSSLIGKRMLALQGYQTIVGILEETGSNYDYEFFSPYSDSTSSGEFSQIRRLAQNTQLRFAVSDPEDLDSVSQLLEQWFTSEYGDGQIIVTNPRIEAEQTVERNSGISLLLLILALSGLFISSVNISHILLSRTVRMKKHVGILMALGATKKKINLLFSVEALSIIVIGTVLGVLIAVPINSQMQSALELTVSSNYMIVISALISAILIYAFTIIPIRRFDKIKPADAMRTQ